MLQSPSSQPKLPIQIQIWIFDQDEAKLESAKKEFSQTTLESKDINVYIGFVHLKEESLRERVKTWLVPAEIENSTWYNTAFPWLVGKLKTDIEKKIGPKRVLPVGSALLVVNNATIKNSASTTTTTTATAITTTNSTTTNEISFIVSPTSVRSGDIRGTYNVYHSFYSAMSLLFCNAKQTEKTVVSVGCPLFGIGSGQMSAAKAAKQMNDALQVAFRYGKQHQLSFNNTALLKNAIHSTEVKFVQQINNGGSSSSGNNTPREEK